MSIPGRFQGEVGEAVAEFALTVVEKLRALMADVDRSSSPYCEGVCAALDNAIMTVLDEANWARGAPLSRSLSDEELAELGAAQATERSGEDDRRPD